MTEAPRDSEQAAGRPDGGAGSDKAPKRDLRHEVKFIAPPTQRASVESWLLGHAAGFHSAYPPRRVNNFYLDDFDLSTYEENLAGVSSRTKVRFRWYGNSPDEVAGTLELKRKRNRLGKNAYELVYETSLVEDLCTSEVPKVEGLEHLTFPVRALYGEDSDVRERGEGLASGFPDCDLSIHSGCTHSVLWEETNLVRDELLSWTTRGLDERGSD